MTGRRLSAFAIPALLVVAWRGQHAFQFGEPRSTGAVVLLAAALALCGVWLLAGRRQEAPVAAPVRHEWLLALALCGLGIAFRTIYFSSVPGGMNHDAAFNGMYALHVLQGAPYTPYVSAAWGRETLFMYVCTALVAWFGNVPEPIQLAATLVAIATLPLFYLFARALCGPRLALVALALLAVSGWHNVFSRVGWRMIMVPPFELMALIGLWRALDAGRWRDWALAGLGMALAIYTYDAGRIVPPMVLALLALFSLIDRRDWGVRLRGGLLSLAVFLVVGAPMLWYAATHFDQFKARAAHLADQRETEHSGLLANSLTAVTMFNYRGNGNDFFINEPLLEPFTGALFVFGVLVAGTQVVRRLVRRSSADQPTSNGDSPFRRRGIAGEFATQRGTVPVAPPPSPFSSGTERADLFVLAGLAIALAPGVLATPNGNRCIAALPFVYVLIARGLAAMADAVAGAMASAAVARAVAPGVIVAAVVIAGAETHGEFLGARRRPIVGFDPEATAAGEYMRGFGEAYSRYVVAERWPEYTLAYLSYNGGGTPLENQYTFGRTLADIEDRINRYGRKGLVFITDANGAGQAALERLQRLFANARVEPITAKRLGGAQVGSALIVEPQTAAHTGLWSNGTRTLAVGAEATAAGLCCFDPVGDDTGVSVRLQIMLPERDAPRPIGSVGLFERCPADGRRQPLLALGFGAGGLELRGGRALPIRPWSVLDAGRWYDVIVSLLPDGHVRAAVDGELIPDASGLAVAGARPPRIAALAVSASARGQFFVDDIAVLPGIVGPADAAWGAVPEPDGPRRFGADFETMPFGQLSSGGVWRSVRGPVAVLQGPAAPADAPVAPPDAGNAFDGGRGSRPGQFNQPVGIAHDTAGDLFVADKNNHRIQKFGPGGEFLLAWGQEGTRPGDFREPHDVAADDEFVYVADTWNQRVQAFDRNGRHEFTITGQPTLTSPRGVFATGKRIYVAEAGAGRVTVYDRAGALQQTIGSLGSGPGQLIEPVDVVVDSHGDVWVANGGNNRIEHFAADGRSLGSIPVPGWSGSGLKESYLAVDGDDTLYLGDWTGNQVFRFRPDGTDLPPLGADLHQPSGIVPLRDRILVVSRVDDVVRVVERKTK